MILGVCIIVLDCRGYLFDCFNLFLICACRLKYLLSQSDIFSHFGTVKSDTTGGGMGGSGGGKSSSGNLTKSASSSSLGGRGGAGRRARNTASDELDDDERAMVQEEDGEDEEGEGGGTDSTVQTAGGKSAILLKQPSCITGGAMRWVQRAVFVSAVHVFLLCLYALQLFSLRLICVLFFFC
jgi:hypothetical protein